MSCEGGKILVVFREDHFPTRFKQTCDQIILLAALARHRVSTDMPAIFGEMGGSHEEEAAQLVMSGKFTKPIIIYVSGAWAPAGVKFSHASAIVERGSGSTQNKISRLREAGIIVVDNPSEIPQRLLELKRQSKLRVK